jgi:hypothetical protein
VLRIIGADGKPDLTTLNDLQATGEVLNDVTVGLYDVVMDTGPGYNSKRMEAVEAIMPLMAQNEIFQVAGDLLFRNMDFPGADVIADRLAAMNPLAKIDEKSPIPPQVQMKMMQLPSSFRRESERLKREKRLHSWTRHVCVGRSSYGRMITISECWSQLIWKSAWRVCSANTLAVDGRISSWMRRLNASGPSSSYDDRQLTYTQRLQGLFPAWMLIPVWSSGSGLQIG